MPLCNIWRPVVQSVHHGVQVYCIVMVEGAQSALVKTTP